MAIPSTEGDIFANTSMSMVTAFANADPLVPHTTAVGFYAYDKELFNDCHV